MSGNERADKLAGDSVIEGDFTLDPPTILSTVRDYLASAREEDSFTKNIVMEKGVKPGEGRKSELRGPARRFSNQLMMETVSMPTLRLSDPFADETNSENKC